MNSFYISIYSFLFLNKNIKLSTRRKNNLSKKIEKNHLMQTREERERIWELLLLRWLGLRGLLDWSWRLLDSGRWLLHNRRWLGHLLSSDGVRVVAVVFLGESQVSQELGIDLEFVCKDRTEGKGKNKGN